jgi:nucleoside-diphosphate-sugar epimerase
MIFVTGASGLVGSHLIQSLLSKGKKVRALYRQAVHVFAGAEQCDWVKGDILDPIGLNEALEGVDYVYHCAAIVSFAPGAAAKMLHSNVEGTANVVNACLTQKVKKLIFVSSVAALGRIRETEAIDESMHWTPETSNSVYGQSKYLAELEVWRAMEEGLPMAIVNPVIILGAGDWNNGSSGIFKSAYNEFPWYTGGMSGFVDVLDVVDAMQLLMESDITGQRYVLSADNLAYRTLFNSIATAFNKRLPTKKVTPFLAGIVWRLEAIKGFFTGKAPLLTKETAATAQATVRFNNQKFLKAFPNFQYRKLEDTIIRVANELKAIHKLP